MIEQAAHIIPQEDQNIKIDKRLEINVMGKKFQLSLQGINDEAYEEIKKLFNTQQLDILELIRAYITCTHKKHELEDSINMLCKKIPNID